MIAHYRHTITPNLFLQISRGLVIVYKQDSNLVNNMRWSKVYKTLDEAMKAEKLDFSEFVIDVVKTAVNTEFTMITPQFNACNRVFKICDDLTGLNRDIAYFAFADRPHPTQEQFIKGMKEEKGGSVLNTFSIWQFQLDSQLDSVLHPIHPIKLDLKYFNQLTAQVR